MSPLSRLLTVLALLCLAPAARAQYYSYDDPESRPVHWYIMGGYVQPTGFTSNILQGGYDIGFGVAFRQPSSPVALRLEFNYTNNNATNYLLQQGSSETGLQITGGWGESWSLSANGEYRFPLGPGIYGYAIAGIGGYYTRINLTEYGYGYVCNPWWYYCYFATGEAVVASHEVTKFGWNAGAGLSFRLNRGLTLFVEARYTQVSMPQNLEFIPVNVGLRF
jgi:opacity protein-like surface antigen